MFNCYKGNVFKIYLYISTYYIVSMCIYDESIKH